MELVVEDRGEALQLGATFRVCRACVERLDDDGRE
jgi:hypothetical protein